MKQLRQIEIARALKAAKNAGLPVERCEVDFHSGKISVFFAGENGETAVSGWDRKLST